MPQQVVPVAAVLATGLSTVDANPKKRLVAPGQTGDPDGPFENSKKTWSPVWVADKSPTVPDAPEVTTNTSELPGAA